MTGSGLPNGVGIGLRAALAGDLMAAPPPCLSFVEVTPENYLGRGGRYAAMLRAARETWPIVTHGLSLSLGGPDPLDRSELAALGAFVRELRTPWHSDHLSFGRVGNTMLHELLPIPFSRGAARHIAGRIAEAEDALGVPLAVENITYYAIPAGSEMDEADFVTEVVRQSGARLLLDVNNVFVNAHNHGFDPLAMLAKMPLESVVQIHVAGHDASDPSLLVDTHAEPVVEDVYALLTWVLERTGPLPVLLEHDDDFPPWEELCEELRRLDAIVRAAGAAAKARAATGERAPALDERDEPASSAVRDHASRVALLCLRPKPEKDALVALDGDPSRWLEYRRMVRRRLSDVIRHAFLRLVSVVGAESFSALEEVFLEARTLRSPFIRLVPLEFLQWLEASWDAGTNPLSAWALELARLEWAERAVSHAENDREQAGELAMDRPVVLTGAHRLLSFEHPVHRLAADDPGPPERRATFLCVYRDAATHTVRVLETTCAAYALLDGLSAGDRTLHECITRAASRAGVAVDEPFIAALSDLLAELSERGVVRGGPAGPGSRKS